MVRKDFRKEVMFEGESWRIKFRSREDEKNIMSKCSEVGKICGGSAKPYNGTEKEASKSQEKESSDI